MQRPGELADDLERGRRRSALKLVQMFEGDPRPLGQLRLRPPFQLAQEADTFPEGRAFVCPAGMCLDDVYAERKPLYAKWADLTVCTDGMTPEAAVRRIIDKLKGDA